MHLICINYNIRLHKAFWQEKLCSNTQGLHVSRYPCQFSRRPRTGGGGGGGGGGGRKSDRGGKDMHSKRPDKIGLKHQPSLLSHVTMLLVFLLNL